METPDKLRWLVIIEYTDRADFGKVMIDELEELQEIIEAGPDFNVIKQINIFYALGNNSLPT